LIVGNTALAVPSSGCASVPTWLQPTSTNANNNETVHVRPVRRRRIQHPLFLLLQKSHICGALGNWSVNCDTKFRVM
jgi:hypothetical protein